MQNKGQKVIPFNKFKGVHSGGGGGDMEGRIGRLESDVEYIKRDVAEIKTDLKEIRTEIKEFRTEITEVKIDIEKSRTDFQKAIQTQTVWLFTLNMALIGATLTIIKFFF